MPRSKVAAARVKLAHKRSAELQRRVRKRTLQAAPPTRFTQLPTGVQELIAELVYDRRNIQTYNFIDEQAPASSYARAKRRRDKGRPLVHSEYDLAYLQTPQGRRAYAKRYAHAEARTQRVSRLRRKRTSRK